MRKIQKRKALELIGTFHGMHMEIQKRLRRKETELVLSLLAQCQEGALHLGNFIEETEGEGFITVGYIGGYCELVYQFYKELELRKDVNANKIYKALRRELLKIETSIKNDVAEHLEMVFLPYKSSMWDSLESVWRAADEDPECAAYVVPIPYFEKNAQGELAAEHYEGDQFPEYVPVIDYRNFVLSERRPDVVFIHNPYDQYNYVTSVHPAYYISELKKYADKVAYIPYYVSSETNLDAAEVRKQKEGFILTPGVLHSDMVFVQSESMKRLYVNVLEKNVSGVGKDYWENKIFGLGSPKMDRVHSTKRDDSRLPSKWSSLIYDKTGKRKKVILYNISLSDLLNQEDMLDKIEDTLAFFEKNRDYVLWWRPHPLYESTIISMRPNLLERYRRMVKQYQAEDWGIFDTGEDLEWAIAETDAYYGDGSSVVQLYLEAGKPILYQNTQVKNALEEEIEIPVWARAFCVDGDDVWFVHGKMNMLMRYHLLTKTGEIIGAVPGEFFFQASLYGAMYKEGDRIYLIPCWGREIAIYNISNNEFSKIKLRGIEQYENKALFCKCFAVNNGLYCIPESYGAIVKIDLSTQEIIYFSLYGYEDKDVFIYLGDAVLFDDKIICPWNRSNQLLVFGLKDESIHWLEFGGNDRKYIKLGKLEDKLVLYDEAAEHIMMISPETGQEIAIDLQCKTPLLSEIPGQMIMIDTAYTDEMFCLDKEGKIRYKKEFSEEKKKHVLQYDYGWGFTAGGAEVCWYFDPKEGILYKFDSNGAKEKYDVKSLEVCKDQIENMMKNLLRCIETENEVFSVKEWLEWGTDFAKEIKPGGNHGKKIKDYLKKVIS